MAFSHHLLVKSHHLTLKLLKNFRICRADVFLLRKFLAYVEELKAEGATVLDEFHVFVDERVGFGTLGIIRKGDKGPLTRSNGHCWIETIEKPIEWLGTF